MQLDRKMAFIRNCLFVFLSMFPLITTQADSFRGRHVCGHTRQINQQPVPIRQSYRRAVYDENLKRMTYRTAYRTVFRMKIQARIMPGCCPGWEKRSPSDTNCMKPICRGGCQNGGSCLAPGLCVCPVGYTGYQCQLDIDECSGRHTCQQKCTNTEGSYFCSCREGFKLTEDNRTCDLCLSCSQEFMDLKNEMDNVQIMKREVDRFQELQHQIDKLNGMQNDMETIRGLQNEVDDLQFMKTQADVIPEIRKEVDSLKSLKSKVETLPEIQNELNSLQTMKAQMDAIPNLQSQMQSLQELMVQLDSVKDMQEQMDKMSKRISRLEEDKVLLQNNLTEVSTQYKEAMNALHRKEVTTQQPTTTFDPYKMGMDLMPLDRLASLSEQISILEERMADCTCNQDYMMG